MKTKPKICKTCSRLVPNLWKNGECKSCSLISNLPKKIAKYSPKGLENKGEKAIRDKKRIEWYITDIWNKRPHYCESCGKWLGNEPLTLFFDHLIEKSSHPELEFEVENIILICSDEHSMKSNGFPSENHRKAIEKAKLRFNIN